MKMLKNWEIHSENSDGITLLCDDECLLHVVVLENYLWRVWIQANGESRFDRTWLISPEDSPVPEAGRDRSSRAGFVCPAVKVIKSADSLVIEGETLRLTIIQPLHLSWEENTSTGWQSLASDRQTGAYQIGHSRNDIAHYMQLTPSDRYFGLGEKAGTLDRFGNRYEMRSLDAMGYNSETTDPLYKHWPFYQTVTESGAHYGIFYDNLNTSYFDMGNELDNYHPRYRSYRAEHGDIDYYFIHGQSVKEITQRFVELTGRHIFPPKWSLGYSGSTMSYTDAPDAQVQLQNFIRLCKKYAIPCDSFQLSSGYTSIGNKRYVFHWNYDKVPEPKALTDTFSQAGIRLAANIKPCLLHDHPKYAEVAENSFFIKDSESDQPEKSLFWDDTGSHLDFTNPDTSQWWKDNVREQLLDLGITSTWNDNNEYEIWDNHARCHGFGDEIAITHVRPLMSLLMMRSSYEAQIAHSDERPYLISRSGCPGMQRYVQTWSGDNRTSWHSLKWNIRMGVGMSISGMYHMGHDVGGFAGGKPDAELFLRWIQSALLLPRFTIHSWNDDQTVNEPWMHANVTPAVRSAIELRYRLLPFLYTLLWKTHAKSEAFVRATFLDHENDAQTFVDTDDYLIGGEMLVCPVTEELQRNRDCYLPNNQIGWYDFCSGQYYCGGETLSIKAPLEKLPLFVRSGSVIPQGELLHADSPEKDTVRILHLYPLLGHGECHGEIYDDDGTNSHGEHLLLNWQMTCYTNKIVFSIHVQGDFRPAYIDNISVCLPEGERRELIIESKLAIKER